MKRLLSVLLLISLLLTALVTTLPEVRASSTLTINPTADGHEVDWTPKSGSDHYAMVDDGYGAVDDDTTYVSVGGANQEEYFTMDDHTTETGAISNVRLYLRLYQDNSEEYAFCISNGSTENIGSDISAPASWETVYTDYATNPLRAGASWSWTDIDNLQAGVSSEAAGGWGGTEYLTVVWVNVTYTAGAPDITEFYWTGYDDDYKWDNEGNWKGLDGGTWYDPGSGDYPKSNVDQAFFNESSSNLYLIHGVETSITLGELTTSSGFTGSITLSIDLIIDDAGGENGHFDHQAVATIDVNTSNEGITVDSHFNVSSASTFTERSGTVTLSGGTTQELRVQKTNALYQLTLANSGTVGELYDNLTLYKVTVPTDTTLKADAATRNYELWMNFSDTAGSGIDIASAGTLDFDGDTGGAEGANITTADASPPPTNYWSADVTTGDMTFNLDYATLTYGRYAAGGGTWNVQDCTFDNFKTDAYTVLVESGGTITNFNDNTLSNSAYGFNSYVAHASFSNVVISSMSTTDIMAENILLEFVDSNFDATQVNLASTGDVVSDNHNDNAGDFYIFATDLLKSSLTVDFATGDAITLQSGKFMLDEAGAAKSVKFLTGTTFQIGQDAPTAARTLTFDDASGAGFDATSAGTLVGSGTGTYQMTINSVGTPPSDYWTASMATGDPDITLDYTTLSYGNRLRTGGTWDIDQCTFDNFHTSAYTVYFESGSTISSFADNTLSNSADGLLSLLAYTGFDNVVISSMSGTDISAVDVKLEFVNSNFDTSSVALSTSGNVISSVHNDIANAYKIMATTLSKSAVTIDYASGSDVQIISGTFTINEASASDDYTVDSGSTLVLNSGQTHTFDSLANMTNSGVVKTDGTITSAGYYDLYNPNPAHIWLNDSAVGKADLNYYFSGFNYSIGSAKNSTLDDFTIETASTIAAFNFTYIDFSNKASGVVVHLNVTQYTGSERIKFLVGNLTASEDYEIYIDLALENTTTADGSGDIFFSRTDLTYSHIYITWVAGAIDLTVFFWTGNDDGYKWDTVGNWKGLDSGTWYDPAAGDYPKSNLDEANFNESASSLYLIDGANSVITIGALTTTTGFTGTITFSIDLIIDSAGGKNGSLNHKAVATIDVNTSNEQINMDGSLNISSSATFTERNGIVIMQSAGVLQEIRVQDPNKLYQLTVDSSGTVVELFDNLTVYKILIGAGTTYRADANTRGYELWTNFSDVAGCGFVSTSSGTLNLIGSSSGRGANITTADASPPPTNRWTMNIGSGNALALTMDYATLSYYVVIQTRGAVDIDHSTFDQSSWRNIFFAGGTTITSFTHNTLSNGHTAMGVSFGLSHTAFDNIVISSTSTADLNLEGTAHFEFVNSNFDTSKVTLVAGANIISKTHNDIANNYQIMATSLSKSTITNDWETGDNIEVVSGTHILDENGEAETIKIDSGATLQVGKTTPDASITLTFDDSVGAGFDSTSAGTLVGSGSSSWGMVITSAGSPPSNYWSGDAQSQTIIADYTTFSYHTLLRIYQASDVENCTFSYAENHAAVVRMEQISQFANNTIDNCAGTYSIGAAGPGTSFTFNNIVITNQLSTYSVYTWTGRPEFTNSNFDIPTTHIDTTGNIISKNHNDIANAYKIMSTTLSKSSITNDYATLSDVQLISGTLTIDIASASNDFTIDSGATLVLNTANTHTFDADANLTNSGVLKSDGDITTSSGYFDFYNPGSIWLNNSTVSNADLNYYYGGFNFSVGKAANSTLSDWNLVADSGADVSFNITSYDFNNKNSGIIWHMNTTASASENIRFHTQNLTSGETYRSFINLVQHTEGTADSTDYYNFSYSGWSTKHIYLTWISVGPPIDIPGPGQWDSWIVGWKYSKNWISNEVRFESIAKYDYEPSWFIWEFSDGAVIETASPNITHTFKWGLLTTESVKLTIIFTDGNRYYAGPEPLILDNTLIVALIVLAVITFAAVSILHSRRSRRREELIMVERDG